MFVCVLGGGGIVVVVLHSELHKLLSQFSESPVRNHVSVDNFMMGFARGVILTLPLQC